MKVLKGRSITKGITEGEAIVSKKAFGFYGAVNPETGIVTDKRHELYGKKIGGKIFVFPEGRGSTAGAILILECARCGSAPKAIVNRNTEPILATGLILASKFYNTEIPTVDKCDNDPIEAIRTGDYVRVDANNGIVEIID